MTSKLKKRLWRIIASGVLFIAGMLANGRISYLHEGLLIVSYLTVGYDVILKAAKNITRGKIFDENFLMTIATFGAFALRDFDEAAAVMLFYQIGELFQSYAINQSRKSISELMDIRPDYANVKRNGTIETVDPEEVAVDDIIIIKAGERVPLDAVVLEGHSTLDTSALTGESVPKDVDKGDSLLSGCININGLLTARVIKGFGESTVSKILNLVENASSKKSTSENFITKFAKYYTPAVVIAAVLLAAIPPLVVPGAVFSSWVRRSLIFLVISCPCALVISIPLSFFGGIGGAAKRGILVKGSNYLEALAQADTIVFDKTGTLTKGVFQVEEIVPAEGVDKAELLRLAALSECYSSHPIALSLRRAYGKDIDESMVSGVTEIPGKGLSAVIDGKTIYTGNKKLMEQISASCPEAVEYATVVYVASDSGYLGYILISDVIKDDSAKAISELKASGIRTTVMLTGDNKAAGENVGRQLGLDKIYTQLLPGDKVDIVEQLLKEQSEKSKLAFVGDGINDAPVLARADIGVAMGGLGSDAAIEAADIVIMTDEPSKLATAIRISKKTVGIAKQNTIFALTIKIAVMILGAMNLATMWAAVFADVGVAVIAILNSLRALKTSKL
ncbi:MAG: heavy metal translocating P-type ATPase [Clostridiaceae bacterium]|nr:heavy metal translocating P-type ATPase [Clostridiaceae bacterium]